MNANDPAFPVSGEAAGKPYSSFPGMTLRAYFAAMPLGEKEFDMLSDSFFAKFPDRKEVSLAELRVVNADALIAELAKPVTNQSSQC